MAIGDDLPPDRSCLAALSDKQRSPDVGGTYRVERPRRKRVRRHARSIAAGIRSAAIGVRPSRRAARACTARARRARGSLRPRRRPTRLRPVGASPAQAPSRPRSPPRPPTAGTGDVPRRVQRGDQTPIPRRHGSAPRRVERREAECEEAEGGDERGRRGGPLGRVVGRAGRGAGRYRHGVNGSGPHAPQTPRPPTAVTRDVSARGAHRHIVRRNTVKRARFAVRRPGGPRYRLGFGFRFGGGGFFPGRDQIRYPINAMASTHASRINSSPTEHLHSRARDCLVPARPSNGNTRARLEEAPRRAPNSPTPDRWSGGESPAATPWCASSQPDRSPHC